MATFGEKLKEIRNIRGLSQLDLAKLLGTSQQNINKWENRGAIPKAKNIAILAQVLYVAPCEFIDDTADEDLQSRIKMATEIWGSYIERKGSHLLMYPILKESDLVKESIKQLSKDDPAFQDAIIKADEQNRNNIEKLIQWRINYLNQRTDLNKKVLTCSTQDELNDIEYKMNLLDEKLADYILGYLPYISSKGRAYIADIIDGMLLNPEYTTPEYKDIKKKSEE